MLYLCLYRNILFFHVENRSICWKLWTSLLAENGIWIIHGGTRKITVCSSTSYGVNNNLPCHHELFKCHHESSKCRFLRVCGTRLYTTYKINEIFNSMVFFKFDYFILPCVPVHAPLSYPFFLWLSKKGCESGFPYCFLTDFTKFFLWGSTMLDFGSLAEKASWIYRIFIIWCHDKKKKSNSSKI